MSERQHRARQLRARIVEMAGERRAAYQQHWEAQEDLLRSQTTAVHVLRGEERRTWDAMEQQREALFALLGELEELEGDKA